MALIYALRHIDLDKLSAAERAALRKQLQDQMKELRAVMRAIDAKLKQRPRAKKAAKR